MVTLDNPITPADIAGMVYALSDLGPDGAGKPDDALAALVIAKAHGLPKPVIAYLNAVREYLSLGLIRPSIYSLVGQEVYNPKTGKVTIFAPAPKVPNGAAVIRATRKLLLPRLDELKIAALEALPRPPDPTTTLSPTPP